MGRGCRPREIQTPIDPTIPAAYTRPVRWAKSYSIVDHQLLHGGYFRRLSPTALALYLFYVVVGDREGKSFYADSTVAGILRFSIDVLGRSKTELAREGLIEVRSRFVWVTSLDGRGIPDPLPQGHSGAVLSSDRRANGGLTQARFADLLTSWRERARREANV